MHHWPLNLSRGVIQVHKLPKRISKSLNWLIGSPKVQITYYIVLNNHHVKLSGH